MHPFAVISRFQLLLLLQSFLYALPAWVLGLIIARLSAIVVLNRFTNLSGLPVSGNLTPAVRSPV